MESHRSRRPRRWSATRPRPGRWMAAIILGAVAVLSTAGSATGHETYEDCEQPPEIAHGSARLTVDDNEEYVTAHYTCQAGFRLQDARPAQLRCSIETDEWQTPELPACVRDEAQEPAVNAEGGKPNGKRKPGQKGQNIQEEPDVDGELAAQLDLSCMTHGLIRAPEIDNGYVVKYNRRKKDGHIFLVAYYECDDYHALQPTEVDRLYCCGKKWIGKRPECISTRSGHEDDEEGEDEEDEEEGAEEDYEEEGEEDSDQTSKPDDSAHETEPKASPTAPTSTTPAVTTTVSTSTTTTTTEHPETTPAAAVTTEDQSLDTGVNVPENLSVAAKKHSEHDTRAEDHADDHRKKQDEDEETDEEEQEPDEDDDEPDPIASESEPAAPPLPAVPTTTTPATTIVAACGPDRGGCDHECRMIYHGNEVEPVAECSCYRGFVLDARDGRTCHDIDECLENNGGCEQTCVNKPGSYDCACEPGLQIDTLNGHTCIDVNECLLRNGHGPCQDTCRNRWGSYSCGCEGLPGTRLAADGHGCEDDGECAKQNGGCSHRCLSTLGRVFCLCPEGLRLGPDWRTCEDVDECENAVTGERCYRCENTYGSYRCLDAPTTTEHAEDDDTEDDDESATGDYGTDGPTEGHHQLPANELPQGAHQSTARIAGSDAERFDSTRPAAKDVAQSGESERSEDETDVEVSPPNQHHHRHHHGEETTPPTAVQEEDDDDDDDDGDDVGSEPDGASEADEDESESSVAEPVPVEEAESGETQAHGEISTSATTESTPIDRAETIESTDRDDDKEDEEDADQVPDYDGPDGDDDGRPTPPLLGTGCGEGLRLHPTAGTCEDIDECVEQEHGCDYCQNAYGGYQCTCPAGYELADDDRRCVDVDECNAGDDGSICSHECHNTIGSYECRCPGTFHLNNDRRTCVRDFCQDLYEEPEKTRCSHECVDEVEGFRCRCPDGLVLDAGDQKTCRSVDGAGCDDSQRKRCDPGACRRVGDGGADYRCECPDGYVPSDHACHDRDECQLGRHRCSHECHNTPGSYRCACPAGLTLSSDGKTCDDVDECGRETNELEGVCGELECRNTYGSYKCVCPEGRELDEYGICRQMDLCRKDNGGCSHICTFYNRETYCDCPDELELAEDGKTCETVNECGLNNGGCSHTCDPAGEPRCRCPAGMQLAGDRRTCEDVNECRTGNGGCEQSCLNFEGGYRCSCFEGYELEQGGRRCVDRDECSSGQRGTGGCDHNCHNTDGSYYCTCHSGYRLAENSRGCVDVNECEDHNGNCSHVCINLLGSHQCSCPTGLFLQADDRTCDFVDECELNNGGCSHTCHYANGVVSCSCPAGFQLESTHRKTCVDMDECSVANGGCSHGCHNTPGSFWCACPARHELRSDRLTCQDVDECIVDNGNCSNICINVPGGHRCACEIGYELAADGRTCSDVDECSDGTHDCSHGCVNVAGAYECECPVGFRVGRNRLACEDVDECAGDPDPGCEHRCVNTIGSFRCACPEGHRLAADNRTCSDVDECSDGRRCTHECVNTIGGFECRCPPGLRLDIDGRSCVDIDECRINSFNGGCSHECENTDGSFRCRCPAGMVLGEDQATCADIDECAVLNGGCSQLCINRDGGFRCGCHPGYSLMEVDNKTCEVSNPCALRNGGCQHYCSLKAGQPVCSCREGYLMNRTDLVSCVDHNECLVAADHNCQQRCINLEGSYRCDCYAGYEKNALGQCADINECLVDNGGCGGRGQCVNTAGGSRCTCPVGFKLAHDRKSCVELQDHCRPLEAPRNADIRCTRSRHKTQLFYRSKCIVTCRKGFKLHGPSVRHCNGTGEWDEGESICVPLACPRLSRPANGVILPVACTAGKIFSSERCVLHCKPGFKPLARRTAVCNLTQAWVPSDNLQCVPLSLPSASPAPAPVSVKPFIQCPPDMHEVLPLGQHTMLVRIERPKTNVDWHRDVDAHPGWGKQLQTELPAGETIVTFRARSPSSNVNDVCRVVIKVRERKPPTVMQCPESFEVQLERNEPARSVFWAEPKFESASEIKQLYKSNTPGQPLPVGVHYINYIATDADGLSANCNFRVVVKAAPMAVEHEMEPRRSAAPKPAELSRLENHESFLICPGKPPVRLDANYPASRGLPPGRESYYDRHQRPQYHQQQQQQLVHYQQQQPRQHAQHHRNRVEQQAPGPGSYRWHEVSFIDVATTSARRLQPTPPPPPLHVPQGCVVKNIRIKQKLARLRHQQRMLAQHLQHLEETPNASPALVRQQHQRYNNLLRYYSSWDRVSGSSSSGGVRASPAVDGPSMQHRPTHPSTHPMTSSHYQQHEHHQRQHHQPRRWLRKRSRANTEVAPVVAGDSIPPKLAAKD